MRSRTELVTTTFIDSEEDPTESDDSEEDWRPSQSGKRRLSKSSKVRRKKRTRLNIPPATHNAFKEAWGHHQAADKVVKERHYFLPKQEPHQSTEDIVAEQKLLLEKFAAGKNSSEKSSNSGPFRLYLYKRDLDENYKENSHLCLWGRDGTNLLQKYIRVKTTNPDEFIFTTSSVYSSWDERRRRDFTTISVKYMEENNRRVTLVNPADLVNLANEAIARRKNFQEAGNKQHSPNEAGSMRCQFDNEDENDEDDDEDDDIDDDNDEDEDDDDYDDDGSYDESSEQEQENETAPATENNAQSFDAQEDDNLQTDDSNDQ